MGTLMSFLVLGCTHYKNYARAALGGKDLSEVENKSWINWRNESVDSGSGAENDATILSSASSVVVKEIKKISEKRALRNRSVFTLKPIVIHGNFPEKKPLVLDVARILRNLDPRGNLETLTLNFLTKIVYSNLEDVTTLLVSDFHQCGLHIHCAYAHYQAQGKSYFCKQGDLGQLISMLPIGEDLKEEDNGSNRKVLLANLHHLLNQAAGSVWLNGVSISGPEDPMERILVARVQVKSVPCRITINVEELTGLHCVRTKTRLEIYGKSYSGDKTKSIWFRGDFSNCLMVTEVAGNQMSVLLPSYCDLQINN